MLLAAVALGCAQAGWTLLTPGAAGASNASVGGEDPVFDVAGVQSPFAPDAGGLSASSHAVAALLSSIELNGIRMSADPARSGAMFTLGEGEQRAFLVGEEVAEGVTLTSVEAGFVLLEYNGGERRLEMTAAPEFSFARAMMGLEPAAGAPALVDPSATPSVAEAGADLAPARYAEFSAEDRAWLASTLSRVEMESGVARGWRVVGPAQAAFAAGLREGDLVTAVNGAGPRDLIAALAAAQSGRIELQIERNAAPLTLVIETERRT
jgi:general secretion pathway protein C